MRYILVLCYAFIVGCNNNTSTTPSTDSIVTVTPVTVQPDTAAVIVTPSCYAHQTSNNIVLLELNSVNPVSGKLTYDIMGQDKNEGAITGSMRGDTLYADFNFLLKGKQTVREVAFLRRGEVFVEGTGDTKPGPGKMVFSKPDSLNFNGVTLKEVPCAKS